MWLYLAWGRVMLHGSSAASELMLAVAAGASAQPALRAVAVQPVAALPAD